MRCSLSQTMKYKPQIVLAYFQQMGIPTPELEARFHPQRKWRWDFSWPSEKLALEVQGGIWIAGGHNRGAKMCKEHEKRNAAAVLGWRILYVEPKDLCTVDTCHMIRTALV